MNRNTVPGQETARGIAATASGYFIWGLLPVYWKNLGGIAPLEILAHRIFWGFLTALIVLKLTGQKTPKLRENRRSFFLLFGSGLLVTVNWGVYIYAVSVGKIVEASLGYYITPLVSVLLGTVFLKEKLNLLRKITLVLAAAGVLWLTIGYGSFPWLSVTLAFSFGFYGLLKKIANVPSLPALAVETGLVAPAALIFLSTLFVKQDLGFLHHSVRADILLIAAGGITILPLFLYGYGARRIPLTTVGFLQYLTPTLMLMVGTLIYAEPFDRTKIGAFLFIWTGLALYTLTLFQKKEPAPKIA